jgi:hypothetical protein
VSVKIFSILLILTAFTLNAQQTIKKGEKASYDGYVVTSEQYNILIERSKKLELYEKELDPNQKIQVDTLLQIIKLKDEIIDIYDTKYGLAKERVNYLEQENKRLRFINNILIITNNIGWTVTVGYTAGVVVFAVTRDL